MAIPQTETFKLIQSLNFDQIEELPIQEKRSILPCLVRMCICETLDVSDKWKENRKKLKKILQTFQEVNDIALLINFDYNQLENEVKKEMQLRFKLGSNSNDSFLLNSVRLENGVVKTFETCTLKIRMKIILNELILMMAHVRNYSYSLNQANAGPVPSELFDCDIYLDEIIDLLYFAISEMPNTFQLYEVVEALLIVKNGLPIICRLVSNFPDSFHEICMTLINNCEKNDEDNFYSINRVNVLRKLCQMNPSESLIIRGEAVELCRMPNLVIMLTLDHIKSSHCQQKLKEDDSLHSKTDVISFITGILLSNDDKVRTWFSQFIKNSQVINADSNSSNSFMEFRQELLKRFKAVADTMSTLSNKANFGNSELILTEACIMLRLYCALRGVASMKFLDEETAAIGRMIVCRPTHSYIGVRFVSFGLSMILAFPQLVKSMENEAKIVDWIKWLVKEESYFGKVAGMKSSFGEMLLLIAIHFHSNQMAAIGELVSSTIGIKLPIRTNDLNLIKHIFTQEIFTEQTVTSHAIKVPVTKNLNSSVSGFLPIHCIYQLLKSRAFTKNKVPIKDWIFNQIRNCVSPIHQILPSLIEAYVNSILIPNTQSYHMTNEPISEEELNSIFAWRVYSFDEEYPCKTDSESDSESDDSGEDDDEMDVDDDETEGEMEDSSQDKVGSKNNEESSSGANPATCLLTSQLLLLYYVLLYEDVRLANMKNILNSDRKVLKYSEEFIARLPIFYLVQKTRTCQKEYGVLMPPLLRLLAFHYPYLCLVKDWLPKSVFYVPNHLSPFFYHNQRRKKVLNINHDRIKSLKHFKKRFNLKKNVLKNDTFEKLLQLPAEYLWPLAADFIQTLPMLLEESTPRIIRSNVRQIWLRLNHIFPTKLWVMTVNILSQNRSPVGRNHFFSYSWSEIVRDPLIVLKCDKQVFRTPELMEMTLHMLNGFLSASRINNTHFLMENPSRNSEEDKKREELSISCQSLTESTAIQILLECCLLNEADFEDSTNFEYNEENSNDSVENDNTSVNLLSNLREVQGLICTHLHQCFISDPNMARLVHFQGYQKELLPLVVAGIPSMHICLDLIPELLSRENLQKQSFAIDLCSHLCVQYPIHRFFNVAKLCLSVAMVHLSVLPSKNRTSFYLSILPALERICNAFPPLSEEFVKLLVQLAQKNLSSLSSNSITNQIDSPDSVMIRSSLPQLDGQKYTKSELASLSWSEFEKKIITKMSPEEALSLSIHKSFAMLSQLGHVGKIFKDKTI